MKIPMQLHTLIALAQRQISPSKLSSCIFEKGGAMEHKINPLEMTVAEILDRWPAVIPVFLEYRLSCVGCSMSEFETLSDAMEIYHLPRDQFLGDVEKAIRSSAVDQYLEV